MERNFFSGLEIYFKGLEIYFSAAEIYFQATEIVLSQAAKQFIAGGKEVYCGRQNNLLREEKKFTACGGGFGGAG